MILAVNLQVSFLLFESQREHLKFQLEHYLTKLMEIVSSDSNRISYEHRELALGELINLNLIMRYMIRDIVQYYKYYL